MIGKHQSQREAEEMRASGKYVATKVKKNRERKRTVNYRASGEKGGGQRRYNLI